MLSLLLPGVDLGATRWLYVRPGAIYPALIAIFFYGVLFGGFIIQALLGGIGGLLAAHFAAHDKHNIKTLCIVFSTIGASLGVLTLAILDKIIGTW